MKKFLALMGAVVIALCCLSFVFHQSSSQPTFSQSVPAFPISTTLTEKQRGVSWTAGREIVTQPNLTPLTHNAINWIAQTPFGWQEDYDTPQLSLITQGNYWGETDEGLRVTTQLAQSAGIHTLLKPHIWLTRPRDGKLRSNIEMRSVKDWQTWFGNYRTFMLHYAKFARTHNIEMLCIGTELQRTAAQREQDRRELIADIRQLYDGKLTYAANWYEAFFQTVWPQDWLAGVYFWKWFPQVDTAPDEGARGFTPQNKPAE